ncbi:MAG TPA: hypothetical protein VMT90_02490 [Dehalococcoidia bacterium]|nr:hypothetical protein [Dehalococcoidia bacterium]
MPDDPPTCHVCGEPLGDEAAACNNCHRRFHLRLREGSDAPECGRVWINEQFLSLEYACDVCLGVSPAAEPPVGGAH